MVIAAVHDASSCTLCQQLYIVPSAVLLLATLKSASFIFRDKLINRYETRAYKRGIE